MEVVRALLRADLRRRWPSWVALAILVGVVGGVALASVAGYRRTSTAMDRFLAYHRAPNAFAEGRLRAADLAAIPGVESVSGGDYMLLLPVQDGEPQPDLLGKVSPFTYDSPDAFRAAYRPIVVAGRLADPDRADEVVVDEEMADLFDLVPGDRFQMQAYGMDQIEELFDTIGELVPTGEVIDLVVAGVIRSPQDVLQRPVVPDVVHLGSAEVHLGRAFHRAHWRVDIPSLGVLFGDDGTGGGEGIAGYELLVDVGELTRAELTDAVRALDPDAEVALTPSDAAQAGREADRSIRLQALALLAFGVLVAVGGGLLASQAIARLGAGIPGEDERLLALGVDARTTRLVAVVRATGVGLVAVCLAVAVAVLLSGLAPVGTARRAEIDPGIQVDAWVLAVGATALLAAVVVRGGVAARGGARRQGADRRRVRGPAGLTDRAARLGLPVEVVSGIRAAQLGGGRSVAVVVLVAVVGVVGGLTFAAAEERLADDPQLWGWTFDAAIGDGNDPTLAERAAPVLADDDRIAASAAVHNIDDAVVARGARSTEVEGAALDPIEGTIEPLLLSGSTPASDDQVALGGATARLLGAGVGDDIEVDLGDGPSTFTVSGLAVFNLGFDAERMGEGLFLTPEGLRRAGGDAPPLFVLADYARGADPAQVTDDLQAEFGNIVLTPIRGLDVHHLHGVRNLPTAFSLLVVAIAGVTLALVLGRTVRHRRRDLAVLRTLGFESRQLRATIAVQATVLVVPAALLGAVLGIAAGRVAWSQVARGLGAPEVQAVPVVGVAASIVGAWALAALIAAAPARAAGRTSPATTLRAE
jgi:ABC-type lipoprotein release transport system permease subunit